MRDIIIKETMSHFLTIETRQYQSRFVLYHVGFRGKTLRFFLFKFFDFRPSERADKMPVIYSADKTQTHFMPLLNLPAGFSKLVLKFYWPGNKDGN